MKKRLQFKIVALTILFATILHGNSLAQTYSESKTLDKNESVPSDVSIQFKNYSADLKIFASTENKVSLKTTLEVSAKSKEAVDKVISAIENSEFSLSGNTMSIDTRFYKSMNTTNNRSTVTLQNGDKVKIREFKIRHELHIPKTASLNLSNKYSDIEMESLEGNVKLDLYNSKLYAHDFNGGLNIITKYSKIKIESIVQNASFDFYDTDIELESAENINIKSKYSKFEITKAGEMLIDSYDDKFVINEMSILNFVSKYSDMESQADLSEIKLEIYDCNIKVNSAERAVFNGKYSDVALGNVSSFKSDDSYDNNIYLANTSRIEIGKSRYSLYDFKSASFLKMNDSYDDNVKIAKINADFSELSLNGKYGKLELDANDVPFQVDFKMKYAKYDIPESVKITKHIEKNSELELIGGNSGGKISVEGYNMKVVIND